MVPGRVHPAHLLWYVMGDLPPEEARATRDHVRFCRQCREECAALVSTLRTLRSERPAAEEEGDRPPEDVSLQPAVPQIRPVPPPRVAGPRRPEMSFRLSRFAASLVLALAVLALPAAWALWRPDPAARVIEPVHRVTLLPPVRAAGALPALEGSGPWLVRVVLPFGSPAGPYSLRLGTGRGTPGEMGETVTDNQDGALELIVQPLSPGRYELTVEIDRRPPHDTFVYPFEVLSPPPRRPAPRGGGRPTP